MLKKVAFTMYPVENLERAKDFYKKNLGLVHTKVSANGGWVEYDLPGGGCFAITNLAVDVTPSDSKGGSVAFEVDDLEGLMAKLKSNGVKVKLDIFPTPVCKMAVILDSEGNSLILHKLHEKQ